MIISGVVIEVTTGSASAALAAMQGRPGVVQVEGPVAPNRLVAVLEAEDNRSLNQLFESLMAADGVMSVNPAFIHFDAEEETPAC